jgi:hypothetical protein
MNTTTLYAELVVVGSGAMISIVLFFCSLFGDSSWVSKLAGLATTGGVGLLIPMLSIVYLLGIVTSNLAFILFKHKEDEMRRKTFPEIKHSYEDVRNDLYTSPHKDLIDEFEFRRSKIRICRGWFINSIAIIVALSTYLFTGKIPNSMVWFSIITVGLLTIGTGVSWRSATDTELEWLHSYATLKRQQSAGAA